MRFADNVVRGVRRIEMNFVNNMNSLVIEGNVARDADIREPKQGFKVAEFPIGTNRVYRRSNGEVVEETSFFTVRAYKDLVNMCETLGKKGNFVRIVGSIKQDKWNDKNGNYHSRVYIIAKHIEFKSRTTGKALDMDAAIKAHEEAVNAATASKAAWNAANTPVVGDGPQDDAVF